jgi:alpha-methylacyl-CoA racemase
MPADITHETRRNSLGPLAGIKVIEMSAPGPAPFCAMMLSDLGAEVVQVCRPSQLNGEDVPFAASGDDRSWDVLSRGRRSIVVDAKHPAGAGVLRDLIRGADVLLEGFRPTVMERLGFGPDACRQLNDRLVYARMTGWGQEGPWAERAGHDINYIAMSGALDAIGREGAPPTIPLNLGGLLMVVGIVAALLERQSKGKGQVVDAAMVDGVALMTAMTLGLRAGGVWSDERGTNFNDSRAHFYNVYRTADGRHVAVGAIEPSFYRRLMHHLGLDADEPDQWDREQWPRMKRVLADKFAQRPRDEWTAELANLDTCVTPVLSFDEAPRHPHHRHRETYVQVGSVPHPAPAPRFGRTPGEPPSCPVRLGEDTDAVLAELGMEREQILRLRQVGAVAG